MLNRSLTKYHPLSDWCWLPSQAMRNHDGWTKEMALASQSEGMTRKELMNHCKCDWLVDGEKRLPDIPACWPKLAFLSWNVWARGVILSPQELRKWVGKMHQAEKNLSELVLFRNNCNNNGTGPQARTIPLNIHTSKSMWRAKIRISMFFSWRHKVRWVGQGRMFFWGVGVIMIKIHCMQVSKNLILKCANGPWVEEFTKHIIAME